VQLRDLGEFGLIARIERAAQREARRASRRRGGGGRRGRGGAVSLGIGDDAALLRLRSGEEVAVSVDALVEDVHFHFADESARNIGRRAIVAGLSDLAAMGARPLGCVVGLAAPPSLDLARFDALAAGMLAEAARHEAPVCGGNLTRARETSLHVTVLGAVRRGRAMTRAGTRAGDRVFVTGALGRSALARARAERTGARVRHLPQPRLEAGRRLARLPGLVACIDVSDGLRADLGHLLGPGLGLDLDPDRVPLARGVASGARQLGLDPLELACGGGEDYELLFTLRGRPPAEAALAKRLGLPVRCLGVVERGAGVGGRGRAGWRHF
jgi:thiamine-monophosphate kinase